MNFNNLIYLYLNYLFYVIGDMLIKPIVEFVISLASLLKKKYQLFKKYYIFIKFWTFNILIQTKG